MFDISQLVLFLLLLVDFIAEYITIGRWARLQGADFWAVIDSRGRYNLTGEEVCCLDDLSPVLLWQESILLQLSDGFLAFVRLFSHIQSTCFILFDKFVVFYLRHILISQEFSLRMSHDVPTDRVYGRFETSLL